MPKLTQSAGGLVSGSSSSKAVSHPQHRFTRGVYTYFRLEERNTTIMTELRAGTATFLTMAYILLVNPQVLGAPHTGVARRDAVVATAVSSCIATFISGMFGNLPFGLAPGLGLSAYLSYGLVKGDGLQWEGAFTSVAVAGFVMVFLAVTKLSNSIMRFIPRTIKLATVVGMGLLLTFIGMQSIHLVEAAPDSLVRLGSVLGPAGYPIWLSFGGLMLLSTLTFHRVKGSVLIAIGTVTLIVWGWEHAWPTQFVELPTDVSGFNVVDFKLLDGTYTAGILAFIFVGIFDVSGVLFGIAKLAGLITPDGEVPGSSWAFIGAGVGTVVAAYLGCSPIIIHVESAAGVKEGGRTGLAALTTSAWFALSILFAPLFETVPSLATAPVLVMIGAMMMGEASEIEWKEMDQAIPAFLTVATMPFTFSIPNGIVFGMLSSFVLYFTTGKFLNHMSCCRGGRDAKMEQGDEEGSWLVNEQLTPGYGSVDGATDGGGYTSRNASFIDNSPRPYSRQPSLILRREEYE